MLAPLPRSSPQVLLGECLLDDRPAFEFISNRLRHESVSAVRICSGTDPSLISAHHPALLLQSGKPFFIALVAFAGSNAWGSKEPPAHSSSPSWSSWRGSAIASRNS